MPASRDRVSQRLAGTARPSEGSRTGPEAIQSTTVSRAKSPSGSRSSPRRTRPAVVSARRRVDGPLQGTSAASRSSCASRAYGSSTRKRIATRCRGVPEEARAITSRTTARSSSSGSGALTIAVPVGGTDGAPRSGVSVPPSAAASSSTWASAAGSPVRPSNARSRSAAPKALTSSASPGDRRVGRCSTTCPISRSAGASSTSAAAAANARSSSS